jgi:transposase
MLVEAGASVGRMTKENHLTARHRRLASRRGAKRAHVATAHSILTCAYHILLRDEPYRDLGPDWMAKCNEAAHARRLVSQLHRLGYSVTLDKPAA